MNQKTVYSAPWPSCEEDEILAVERVLRSGQMNYWTGQEGRQFEREFAAFVNCRYAVALANGTVALEAALHALGIGPGDDVIVPSRTFIATASSVAMCGARPVVADVDRDSQNLTVQTIKAALTPETKAIIAVHLAGWPCDMNGITAFAKANDLFVIEDCAQALGARYQGKPVGSFGDVAAFSFCQDKIMTTGGEGGMLVTNNESLWCKVWSFKDHGKSFEAVYHRQHPPGNGFKWLHESFGTNWRMTEMQSAIGRVSLPKVPGWIDKRRAYAAHFIETLDKIDGVRIPVPKDDIFHAYYKFYLFVEPDKLSTGWSRDRIMEEVNAQGVPCMSGSCSEIYLEKAFTSLGFQPADRLPVAKELGETSLMLLVHPTLDHASVNAAGQIIEDVLSQAFAH